MLITQAAIQPINFSGPVLSNRCFDRDSGYEREVKTTLDFASIRQYWQRRRLEVASERNSNHYSEPQPFEGLRENRNPDAKS